MADDNASYARTIRSLLRTVPDQREFWNRWHEQHDHASDDLHAEKMRRIFLSELDPVASKRVLEIGCGQGRDAIAFARAGLTVVAMDHSSVALTRARAAHSRAKAAVSSSNALRIDWHQHDYGKSGALVEEGSFDAVYSHLSLHYFDDETTRCLFEGIRVALRPRGLLFFTVRSQEDALFKKGSKVNGEQNYRCHGNHVRRFFSEDYAWELLSRWSDVRLCTYVAHDRTVNPGTFIYGMARRFDKQER